MTLEDEDNKVRRNLLAVSTGILLIVWLELPVSDLAERVFGVKGFQVSEPRIWFSAVVLLCYFALRFRLSDNYLKYKEAFKKAHEEALRGLRDVALKNVLSAYQKSGVDPKSFTPSLHVSIRDAYFRGGLGHGPSGPGPEYVLPSHLSVAEVSGPFHKVKVNIKYSWVRVGMHGLAVPPVVGPFTYSSGIFRTVRATVRAFLRTLLETNAGLLFALPITVGMCAFVFAVWRFIAALYWPQIAHWLAMLWDWASRLACLQL